MKKNLFIFLLSLSCALLLYNCRNGNRTLNKDRPLYQGDKFSTLYSTLDQINTGNRLQLKVAWEYHTGDASISDYLQILCNPVEINAVFYATSPKLKLFALDAAMGKQKCLFDPF